MFLCTQPVVLNVLDTSTTTEVGKTLYISAVVSYELEKLTQCCQFDVQETSLAYKPKGNDCYHLSF